MGKRKVSATPDTWRQAMEKLKLATTEKQVEAMIAAERTGQNRHKWIQRMRGRYKVLRNSREEREAPRGED